MNYSAQCLQVMKCEGCYWVVLKAASIKLLELQGQAASCSMKADYIHKKQWKKICAQWVFLPIWPWLNTSKVIVQYFNLVYIWERTSCLASWQTRTSKRWKSSLQVRPRWSSNKWRLSDWRALFSVHAILKISARNFPYIVNKNMKNNFFCVVLYGYFGLVYLYLLIWTWIIV